MLWSAVTALYRGTCGCCGDHGSVACITTFIAEVVVTVCEPIAGYTATTVKSVGITGGQLRRRVQHVAVRFVWTDGKDHVSGAVCNGESGICGVSRSGASAGTVVSTGTAIATRCTGKPVAHWWDSRSFHCFLRREVLHRCQCSRCHLHRSERCHWRLSQRQRSCRHMRRRSRCSRYRHHWSRSQDSVRSGCFWFRH